MMNWFFEAAPAEVVEYEQEIRRLMCEAASLSVPPDR